VGLHHEDFGFSYRMDAIHGLVFGVRMCHLGFWVAARRDRASAHGELIDGFPGYGAGRVTSCDVVHG
jgi:dTDP-4-amino-4,6-dideoxygalactose transaminase